MARFLSKTLIQKLHPKMTPISPRFNSSKTQKPHLIELDSESSNSEESIQIISGGVRKLEEVIQSIIARRTAPDWLPFLPGYSYWVPPSPYGGAHQGKLIEVVGRVSAAPLSRQGELTKDQGMAFKTNRGWPSESFMIEDTSPPHPLPMEMEVEVKIYDNPDKTNECTSEDDEG